MARGRFRFLQRWSSLTTAKAAVGNDAAALESRDRDLEDYLSGLGIDWDALVALSGYIKSNGTTLSAQAAPIPASDGGTGIASYAVGDLVYASGATTLAKLADVATGNALISGGVATAPAWGKIGLTTHISGTLAAANGGTGVTSAGSGSGYDADLLDGQHGSYYRDASNLNAGSIPGARLGAWTAVSSPSFASGVTIVNGTLYMDYINIAGLIVFWRFDYTRGSSDSLSGAVSLNLPVTAATVASARQETVGMGEVHYVDANVSATNFYDAGMKYGTTTVELVELANNAGGNDDSNPLASTAPFTWATNDRMFGAGWYQPA